VPEELAFDDGIMHDTTGVKSQNAQMHSVTVYHLHCLARMSHDRVIAIIVCLALPTYTQWLWMRHQPQVVHIQVHMQVKAQQTVSQVNAESDNAVEKFDSDYLSSNQYIHWATE
jgi:hypothetical protein